MNSYFQRGGPAVTGAVGTQQPRAARSAALLIDFDNVTLGVHSDLGRELKSLINSEVFRGKIAVRRAYADWRRYPNYVVPLTEASIDLIFAPAYGSSKKNTTDLRMSADAIELAFTRPEIDTFILLTGDSDFSSTVMKLKEYGKYVIGVGMRESSSDLIIQNCDEYFSYHALTGLTRTTAGEGMKEDPWELAIRAAQKMASTGDAMRTDRLKQVMLSIDPGFNEKELGYSKFSRFVSELEKKGLVRLHKLPDGQYEISVDGRTTAAPGISATEEPSPAREGRAGRREGRRDRHGRRREPGEGESRPVQAAPETAAPAPEVGVEPLPAVPATPAAEVEEPQVAVAVAAVPSAAEATSQDGSMRDALGLLQHAVRDLAPKRGASVRDGDVKRRMVELEAGFDEATLGFSKFSRFLRAAHDTEAIDLQRLDSGSYEVSLGSKTYSRAPTPAEGAVAAAPPAPPAEAAVQPAEAPPAVTPPPTAPAAEGSRALRGRRRGRGGHGAELAAPPILPGQVVPSPREQERPKPTATDRVAAPAAEAGTEAVAPAEAAPAVETERPLPTDEKLAAAPAASGRRRGRRGRRDRTEAAPPQVLPEQVVAAGEPQVADETEIEAPAPEVAPAVAESATPAAIPDRKRRSRGRGRKAKAAETPPTAAKVVSEAPAFSAEALGLPTSPNEIADYVTRTYRGVGKKTVEPLVDAFGPDIFRVFAEEPQRVGEVIGERRADVVLSQWAEDFGRRAPLVEEAQPAAEEAPAAAVEPEAPAQAAEETATKEEPKSPARRSRRSSSRGRNSNGRTKTAQPVEAESAPVVVEKAPEPAPSENAREAAPARKRRGGRKPRAEASATTNAPTPTANGPEAGQAAGEGESPKRSRSSRGGKGRGGRRKPETSKS